MCLTVFISTVVDNKNNLILVISLSDMVFYLFIVPNPSQSHNIKVINTIFLCFAV